MGTEGGKERFPALLTRKRGSGDGKPRRVGYNPMREDGE